MATRTSWSSTSAAGDEATIAGSWPWTSGRQLRIWKSTKVTLLPRSLLPSLAWPLSLFPPRDLLFAVLEFIKRLEPYCSEFLVHAADNEGLQKGIDEELVQRLAEWCSVPVTYAGGGRNLGDLDLVKGLSGGKVDLTIGSALDCFGGDGVTLAECVEWNRGQ